MFHYKFKYSLLIKKKNPFDRRMISPRVVNLWQMNPLSVIDVLINKLIHPTNSLRHI